MPSRIDYFCFFWDSSVRHVLVELFDQTWAVPIVTYDGAPFQLALDLPDFLARLGVAATPIHEAFLADATSATRHAYCAFVVTGVNETCRLTWVPCEVVLQTPSRNDLQRWAFGACVARLVHPEADFDSVDQLQLVEAWTRSSLAKHGYTLAGQPHVLRHTRLRRVALWPTTSGDVYLKANSTAIVRESRVTSALSGLLPRHFAKTIVTDPARGWWLYEGVVGDALIPPRLSREIGASVGFSVATLQRQATEATTVSEAFGSCRLSGTDLLDVATMARTLVHRVVEEQPELLALQEEATWSRIFASCHRLGSIPQSFVHPDLCLPNIVYDGTTIGLIDLEWSYWGPVVLCLWRLLNHIKTRCSDDVSQTVVAGYVSGWQGGCSETCLKNAIADLGMTARLYELKVWLDAHGLQPSTTHKAGVRQARPPLALLKGLLLAAQDVLVCPSL